MNIPKSFKFTKEHEWVEVDDTIATIGITDFAQESLGDITYVQLPKENAQLNKDDTFGVVESVKAVSDLYVPITGKVLEINQTVLDAPEIVNQDPYQDGWMVKIEMDDPSELDELMDATQYKEYLEEKS